MATSPDKQEAAAVMQVAAAQKQETAAATQVAAAVEKQVLVEKQEAVNRKAVEVLSKPKKSKPMRANTTEQEDIVTAGQRRINLIWEHTQAAIALMVCFCTMAAGMITVIATMFYGKADGQIPTILAVAFGTVIGFYFSRTNHTAVGGVGKKDIQIDDKHR